LGFIILATTFFRDIVEVRLELAGVPCIVSDTAGLREHSQDVIELEGMRRARYSFVQDEHAVLLIAFHLE